MYTNCRNSRATVLRLKRSEDFCSSPRMQEGTQIEFNKVLLTEQDGKIR